MPEIVQPKPGDFYLCKYRGTGNGDLIAGRVVSCDGERVTLENLCGSGQAVKKIAVLLKRNWRAHERFAREVAARFKADGKAAARELAVELYRELRELDATVPAEVMGAAIAAVENMVRDRIAHTGEPKDVALAQVARRIGALLPN